MSKIEVNTVEPQCGTTLTLGASGDTVTLGAGASQSGFGRTGTVDWQTGSIKTSTFTAANGEGYFVNTSGGAVTANLPAGSAGAIVSFADYTRTFQTNNLTITPNGSEKIGGVAANFVAQTEGQSITLVYVDATEGWINTAESTGQSGLIPAFITATGGTITCSGDYKIHTFTGPATFTVTCAGNPLGSSAVDYLVVAGGGGGGGSGEGGAGGGGAGGFRESHLTATSGCYTASPLATPTSLPVSATGYPITVGAGGTGGIRISNTTSTSGVNSTFSTITSAGGGAGGHIGNPYSLCGVVGQPGGSGGGGFGGGPGIGCGVAGTGNTPPVSPPQGTNGGLSGEAPSSPTSPAQIGGGGGGATVAGTNAAPTASGPGGAGATTSISASPTAYAGGGGAGSRFQPAGTGGAGGGGAGSLGCSTSPATAGTANTGGGGGGAGRADLGGGNPTGGTGGGGGSGIVIIRYKFQ